MGIYDDMQSLVTGDLLPSDNDYVYVNHAVKQKKKLDEFLDHPGSRKITSELDDPNIKQGPLHHLYASMAAERDMLSAWLVWYDVRHDNPSTTADAETAKVYLSARTRYLNIKEL